MSCFKYIVFPFLTFLSSLYGEVWTNCSETFEIAAQARIIGDTVAFVAGRDVASADSAGGNAVENNWWWTLDAYHYGKIYTERGKQGVVEEIKEHPVEAAMAVGGLGFIGRIGKGAKVVRKHAKAEKVEQKTVQTGKIVTEVKPQRIVETKETQEACWKPMKESGEWVPVKGPV